MSIKFDLLEKFRRALFSSGGLADGVRDASEADYLVKMNIPPLLGRRDAACEFLRELLRHELKELPLQERLESYHNMLNVLEYAIIDTERVKMTLASAETAGRENRLLAFWAAARMWCIPMPTGISLRMRKTTAVLSANFLREQLR